MIKKVRRGAKDIESLGKKVINKNLPGINIDYHGVVVNKPWGYEYLMYENSQVAVWVLYLKSGSLTSMHCHPNKKTALLVLSGEVETSSLDGNFHLKELDCLLIDSAAFHSTRAVSPEGAVIMEIETPPNKNDLVRLNDAYGRENKGYEGIANLSFELRNYEYCYFTQDDHGKSKQIKNKSLHLAKHPHKQHLHEHLKQREKGLVALLEGDWILSDGRVVWEVGDVKSIEEIKEILVSHPEFNESLTSLIII